jgi:L-malate glycosyltransferase
MKIALMGEGSVVHTLRWAEYFHSRGDTVRLFTLENPPDDFQVDWKKVGRRDQSHALSYTLALPRMKRALDDFAPDMVNAHFVPNYGWMGALVGRRPLVVSTWGSDVLVNPRKSPFHRWRLRYVLERADLITSDAEMMTEEIHRYVNGAAPVLTAPMGMDRAFYDRGEGELSRDPVLLQFRNLEPVYDLPTVLKALPDFLAQNPTWRVRIAGEGSQRVKLERMAAKLGFDERVSFLGRLSREELVEELRRARLYLSASLSDSTSVSLLEAMALGAYPVLSDIPANREWVGGPGEGLYFPPGDSIGLSKTLNRAAQMSEEKQREAAVLNRNIIAERAIWEDNMDRVREAFLTLAEGRS